MSDRRSASTSSTTVVLAVTVAVAIGCQDEPLEVLVPSISVCPAEDAQASACDRPVELGEVPVTVPLELALFVRNQGDGRLQIAGVDADDSAIVIVDPPAELAPGQQLPMPFTVTLPAGALGARTVTLTFRSDDPDKPNHPIALLFEGVAKPAPDVIICTTDDPPSCGTALDLSFGVVRRSQQQGLALVVKNQGTAALSIGEVRLESQSSVDSEIVIATSTRPARLAAGDAAPLVLVYRPADGGADAARLVLASDDEDTPEATVDLSGESADNLPPVAQAFETLSGFADVVVLVDDVVQLDASGSADPEGDPLRYRWSLSGAAGSTASLDDAAALRTEFVPDLAGSYLVRLVVEDSLGQESAPFEVSVLARPRFALRAQLSWVGGGDLDLHVLEQGGALFSARDCCFENRDVDFGGAGAADNCLLLDDAVGPPGPEQAVIAEPAAGSYQVWVQVFDAGGLAAIEATVRVILDDAADPVVLETRQLPGDCSTWHVADVTFPGGGINVVSGPIGSQCRP